MLSTVILVLCLVSCINASSLSKIVNGVDATDGDYPYAVSIRYNNCHECGASIISNKWILTAAHCIFLDFMNVSTIHFGSVKSDNCKNTTTNGKIANVKRAIVHHDYVPVGGYYNDIGLIEIEEEIVFNEYVQPVKLPSTEDKPPFNEEATLVGWGYQFVNSGIVMPTLQVVHIDIFPNSLCSSIHPTYSNTSHICAGIKEGGKGQCSGDSGGPLTVNGTEYGIVSWSDRPCAVSPGVLTRVSTFRDWIYDNSGV